MTSPSFSARPVRRRARRGMALLEVVIAVGIFAVGVLSLSGALNDMMGVNILRLEDGRLRQALGAYSEEVYMRPDIELRSQNIDLEGGFEGIRIVQKVEPVDGLVDEEGRNITGIFLVTLTAQDTDDRHDHGKTIRLYVRR